VTPQLVGFLGRLIVDLGVDEDIEQLDTAVVFYSVCEVHRYKTQKENRADKKRKTPRLEVVEISRPAQ